MRRIFTGIFSRKVLLRFFLPMAALFILLGWLRCGPLPPGFLDPGSRLSTVVTDRNGVVLYEGLSREGGRTQEIRPDAIPEALQQATLAAEDHRFFHHPGLDPIAITRAAWRDLRARRIVEGGSTLTQQVVKHLTGRRRSLPGKLREMVLALRLEHRLSKREVLALYLNIAPYGNQFSGAEAASRGYFGCSAEHLTPAQAAFLAGLPQRPSVLDPYRHPDRALARQRVVLKRMADLGALKGGALDAAHAERIRLVHDARPFAAPHFVERILESFTAGAAPVRVETTLDSALQAEVHSILATRRQDLLDHAAHNVAVAVLHNPTGEWLAWEGSGDYADADHGGTIDGVVTSRQPGSALKPFLYALAFERGYTPASVLPDIPAHFPTAEEGVLYSPKNYDGVFRGPLRARAALAGSENVPAVWLLSKIGVSDLLRFLRRSGFEGLDKNADYYGYGLVLGDAEVRLRDMVQGYAALARGGRLLPDISVRRTLLSSGGERPVQRGPERRILSPRAAYWITDILSDGAARAYIFGTGGSLDFPFPVAAKTGTSQAYRDNWTLGYTREVTVGVWVGNFDRKEMQRSSGVTGAGPIFHQVLLAAQKRVAGRLPEEGDPPLMETPRDLISATVCGLSGLFAGPACPTTRTERLPRDGLPLPCTWHLRGPRGPQTRWPEPYRAWARQKGIASDEGTPPSSSSRARATGPLRIINPPPGAIYLYDPTLRPEFQTLPLRAETQGGGELLWTIDGKEVGRSASDRALDWPMSRGRHTATVRDTRGILDRVEFLVK
jgi:penicillin-binding protein 1C